MAPSSNGTLFQRRFQRLFSSLAPCSFGSESELKTVDISLKFSSFINGLTDVSYLAEEKRNVCEGILRYDDMNTSMYYRPSKRINRQRTMV